MWNTYGKITLLTIALGVVLLLFLLLNPFNSLKVFRFGLPHSFADTATTTVTVLNTPPLWTVDAQEAVESSTSSPTNAGSAVTWNGTATDSNNDSYYLLICKTSSTPTANSGAAPTCAGGGGNQWAVSGLTTSTVQALSSYTTLAGDAQINVWVAWICDANVSNPACNATFKQGTGNTASPFIVNHRPVFSSFTNNSPANPGGIVTWFSNASDTDNFPGATDTVALFVCKASDFTGSACGSGGTYCSSSLATLNPSCSSTLADPLPDKVYGSFGYVLDQHNFAASGGSQGGNASTTVNNVAPSIASATISLNDWSGAGNLTLTNPQTSTINFTTKFTARDDNSCMNAAGGNEIVATSTIVNVYRSGITQANCQTTGQYNANNCYPIATTSSVWTATCVQDASCPSSSTLTTTFTCTYALQYLADPTDGADATATQFFNQNWLTSVKISDDNLATSSLIEGSTGNELSSYLAYGLLNSSITYGGLSPGQQNNPIVATTSVKAQGNVGLDHTLYGLDMCTTYPGCPVSATSTVPVGQEKYATSSVGYASSTATALLVNPGALLGIHIPKSTIVLNPASGSTYWGIAIPSSIILAGSYTGQNTIIGVKSPAQAW